ncbi:MAG: hypothetical protein Q7U54_00650 [Bacteroidales bacterium]|nr:hypothetical protein [Bacteroidales bacterium]
MKQYILLIVFISGILAGNVNAANPKIFIVSETKSNLVDAKTICIAFETKLFNDLKEAFPCVEILDRGSLYEMLRWERKRQLLGAIDDNQLQNIAGAIGSDYLIKFKADVLGDQLYLSAFCMDVKKANTIARTDAHGPIGQASENAEKVSKDLVKQLKEYEICAYEGKLTIEVESEKEETTSSSIPCDGGMIAIQTRITTKMNLNWKLNKNGLRKGDGNVTYDMNEKTETTINNPCYICPDGQKTIAQINEKKDVEAKASGLSNESVSEGQKVADCRIKIVFLEDGTYNILIEATSQKGNMKTTIDKKINAPCAARKNEEPEEPRNNEIDVPLKVVLGPYKGTAEDKVLNQDETKDLSQGKEKATAKINFSLTRQ